MGLNALNQNTPDLNFNLNSFMSSTLGTKFGNNGNSDSYYAKKGEPTYQKDMDTDNDGLVTFEEFKEYCKANDISSQDMKKMLETRMAYKMAKDTIGSSKPEEKTKEPAIGNLDLIYAKDGDDRYNADQDSNGDSKVSYTEYLRYCEQNAKMEAKNSDTKIVDYDKSKFMTVSFGHATNAYNRNESDAPEGKIESKA